MMIHKSNKSCSLCTATPSCSKNQTRYCGTCNRTFLSEKCFQNHLTLRFKGKQVCQWRQVCRNCNFSITTDFKHEYFKKFCTYCNKKQPSDQFCYVTPLKLNKLSNKYMFVLLYGVHARSRQVWRIFRTHAESHMRSANVFKMRNHWGYEYRLRTMWQGCPRDQGGTHRYIYWISLAAQTICR